MKKVIAFLLIFLFPVALFASDINCIIGGDCQNNSEQKQTEELYDCVCPQKDTIETILDIFGVLTLPFQFLSSKPNFNPAASSIDNLIKKGCKCRLKTEKDTKQEQPEIKQDNTAETEQPEKQN